jgi:transcriptional/translational regulatory protein YebC/TACO1
VFNKHGGSLGETNSVGFMFDRVGSICYPPGAGSSDEIFEAALEAGAEDVISNEAGHEIICAVDDFSAVAEALAEALESTIGSPSSAALVWRPQSTVAVGDDAAVTLFKLLEGLDENDDVRVVSANYEVSEDVMKSLSTISE